MGSEPYTPRRLVNCSAVMLLVGMLSTSQLAIAQASADELPPPASQAQPPASAPVMIELFPRPQPAPPSASTPPAPLAQQHDRRSLQGVGASDRAGVQRRWYGAETLATDGAALAILYLASAQEVPAATVLGMGFYLLGGPIVHGVHGYGGRAVGSFLLRLGAPAIGGLVGCRFAGQQPEFACLGGFFVGGAIGAVAAIAIDAVIAREEVPQQASTTPRVSIALDQHGAGLHAMTQF